MIVTVSITKRDITQGTAQEGDTCPIARAVKRFIKKSVKVWVFGEDGVEFETKDKTIIRKMPVKATRFVERFDNFDDVEPFEFKLNIPEQLLKA